MEWHLVFQSEKELRTELLINRVGKKLVNEQWLCFLFTGEKLLAFEESCPHQNYSLLGAACLDGKVICPLHKFKFDAETGQGHGLSLSCYPTKQEGGQYYIGI